MGLKKAENQVKILLAETILAMCRNTLNNHAEVSVEGLLGITLDNDEIFLVSINQTINNPDAPSKTRQLNSETSATNDVRDESSSRKRDKTNADGDSSSSDSDEESTRDSKSKRRRRKRKRRRSSKSSNESGSSSESEENDTRPSSPKRSNDNDFSQNPNSFTVMQQEDTSLSNLSETVQIKQERHDEEEEEEDLVIIKEEMSDLPTDNQFLNMQQQFDSSTFQPDFNSSFHQQSLSSDLSQPQPGPSSSNAGLQGSEESNLFAIVEPCGDGECNQFNLVSYGKIEIAEMLEITESDELPLAVSRVWSESAAPIGSLNDYEEHCKQNEIVCGFSLTNDSCGTESGQNHVQGHVEMINKNHLQPMKIVAALDDDQCGERDNQENVVIRFVDSIKNSADVSEECVMAIEPYDDRDGSESVSGDPKEYAARSIVVISDDDDVDYCNNFSDEIDDDHKSAQVVAALSMVVPSWVAHDHCYCIALSEGECAMCGIICPDKTTLVAHAQTHDRKRNYICCLSCDPARGSSDANGSATQSFSNLFMCRICRKTCHSIYSIECHVLTHELEKRYRCPHCYRPFASQTQLGIHKQKLHDDYSPFVRQKYKRIGKKTFRRL